ncbi:VWA domain-containing protein [Pseudomonas sp. 8Z]|uniref:vWA domain-containing protein n=1 Tax=Pseudomonas sp. 8Z TaxID=2653166 RepID=UPI00135CE443
MFAHSLSIVRPLAVGFSASALLLLTACSASDQESVVPAQVQPLAQPISTAQTQEPLSGELMDVPMAAEISRKSTALTASAPIAVIDALPPSYRDETREQYQTYADNPIFSVAESPVSTFSIDVDTGSYANVRRFLNSGQLPPKDAVRLEELVNYFPYAYPLPQGDSPFGISTEMAVTPWNQQTRLLRIAIKASERSVEQLPPANLVFLVDVSGSMQRREGLPMVQGTLKLLVDQLRAQDRVSLVTYADESRVVLESTPGSDKMKIRAAIDQLTAGGSTAGESGIELAYQQAQQHLIDGGINRILLATDGDFNVGVSDFDSLKRLAGDKRKSGVSLTTLGFGVDNYNERLMEQLADVGNGNYAYIDNLREARKVLVDQLGSTLATVASDVKLQVEFNPAEVREYRLLGYENRALKREDFSNDKVDAGDIGAGHTVTALYEIVPVGGKGWLEPLRYQQRVQPVSQNAEVAWLRIRYKAPGEATSHLLERPVTGGEAKPILAASTDLRFSAALAAFAQQLKDGLYIGDFTLAQSIELARSARGEDRFGLRGEFIQLAEIAQSLQNSASTPARVQQ